MRKSARAFPVPTALGLFLICFLTGCYEQPVVERLTLAFLPEGGVRVTVTHHITRPSATANPALDARLEETRQALMEGWDDWSRAFANAHPIVEQRFWEKRKGGLVRHERSAVFEEVEQLREFFSRTALRIAYRAVDGTAEFSVVPAGITRASREQRERVERDLKTWSRSVADYLTAAAGLFAYLEERPDRARACFGALLAEHLSEEARNALPEPTPEEETLLKGMQEPMGEVLQILHLESGEAFTRNELSHLAFNPFPAEFTIEAPSAIVEVEEFERTEERSVRVPGLGLWEAYTAVRGRWLEPDPLQTHLEATLRGENASLDLAAFCALPRRSAEPPDAVEVRRVLETALTPADIYRVVWRVPGSEPGSQKPEAGGQ